MTTFPPQTEEPRPNGTNGHRENGESADTKVAVPRERRRTGAAARPRRAPDYRLRGLDLDAQALAEAPRRPARRAARTRRQRRRLFVQWIVVLALAATVAVGLRASVVRTYSVTSASMVPNLHARTDILVVKPSFLSGPIKAGSIIVFGQPAHSTCSLASNDSTHLVSRVIGLPGETIWSAKGSIYIDGRRLEEPGWYNPPFGELGRTGIARTTIPAGSYFVMGDNRMDACDSRAFGPIPRSLVVGKAVASITRNGHLFVHSI